MRFLYALFTLYYSFIISLITLRVHLRHGVIDKPDPHRAEEVEHLKSRVDLDNEIEEIKKRQEQQVKHAILCNFVLRSVLFVHFVCFVPRHFKSDAGVAEACQL